VQASGIGRESEAGEAVRGAAAPRERLESGTLGVKAEASRSVSGTPQTKPKARPPSDATLVGTLAATKRLTTADRKKTVEKRAETGAVAAVAEAPRDGVGPACEETAGPVADPRPAPLSKAPPVVPSGRNAKGAPPKNVTPPAAALAKDESPADLALGSNDRKPVTKKIEKKAGSHQEAPRTSQAPVPTEAAAPRASSAATDMSPKPAARGPTAKAALAPDTATPVQATAKPTVPGHSAVEPARTKPALPRPTERAASAGTKPGKASSAARHGFKPQEFIVYPAHGVGQIVVIEEQEVAGFKLELFVISFIKDKMILKVPTSKAAMVGMRKLAEADVVKKAFDTLCGRARVKRTMWSRRAQEYEAKINSGDLIAIAEVVRDLYRSDSQPEQSYSERQLYEAALDRITREIVVVQKVTETEALRTIEAQLMKGPRRGKPDEIEPDDTDIEQAA
jgi:CarD family transcriptional regulator